MNETPLRLYAGRAGSGETGGKTASRRPGRPRSLRAYIPARFRDGAPARLLGIGWTPELGAIAEHQAAERQRRRDAAAFLLACRRTARPGRPRKYADHELLAAIGAYRRGPHIHFRRDMPADEQARRRYRLLAPEWQRAVSEEEYIRILLRVKSLRKRANRLRQEWDEEAAWCTGFSEVLADRSPRPSDGDAARSVSAEPLPGPGRS